MPTQTSFGLRMRQLPKPEYALMKALKARWQIEDTSELFAIALRLMKEVEAFTGVNGQEWITNVIDHYRSTLEAERLHPHQG